LQKLGTVPALGAVLLLGAVGLLVQKPHLGISTLEKPKITSNSISDPSSNELFAYEAKSGDIVAEATEPVKTPEPITRVASQSLRKDDGVFVDTINNVLPPAVEAKGQAGDGEIIELIKKYASLYGANADVMIAIARCESGLSADAQSPSGAYKGIYQFVSSTWQSNRKAMGMSTDLSLMFDAEESIKTAAFKMARDGYGAWPVCSQKAMASLALK